MIWIFHRYPKGQTTISFLEAITISISSIFGIGNYDANDFNTNLSARLTLLNTFICGSLFFHIYCGVLTSVLAIPKEYKPFQSPDELLQTNYRYAIVLTL